MLFTNVLYYKKGREKSRKSKKHQKAIPRSFQEVHRPRRDLLDREREKII